MTDTVEGLKEKLDSLKIQAKAKISELQKSLTEREEQLNAVSNKAKDKVYIYAYIYIYKYIYI